MANTALNQAQLRRLRRAPQTNRLRVAMDLVRVTQVQLAAAMSIAQSQISEDVNGEYKDMSLTKARKYADLFGCEVDDLFPHRKQQVA